MTYAELKAKLDAMTPEQLAMKVRWWGDERGGVVHEVDVLTEVWVNVETEGYAPVSSFGADDEIAEGIRGGEWPTLEAGTPILVVDP